MDRNRKLLYPGATRKVSLSARRAWIEIVRLVNGGGLLRSLSARRAWIEIGDKIKKNRPRGVALRKESVDRNVILPVALLSFICRSPQGERG